MLARQRARPARYQGLAARESCGKASPLVDALLTWRKAERIATTYGWGVARRATWPTGRLRGSLGQLRRGRRPDDGIGRPAQPAGTDAAGGARPKPGHRFVRADLGQIEPRVLAAVSGDPALIAATVDADLYQPVALRLGVERDVAKVAVLAAMYGATTGESAGALRGLQRNYPVAMALLEEAAEQGRLGHDIFTIGGRRIRTGSGSSTDGDLDRAIAAAAGPGPLRPQRPHPGRSGRVLQGLGRDRAAAHPPTSGPGWCSASTTSSWSTPRPARPTGRPLG